MAQAMAFLFSDFPILSTIPNFLHVFLVYPMNLYQEMLSEYKVLSHEVESLPYWKNGIRFFKVEGPNKEVIEFCEIL